MNSAIGKLYDDLLREVDERGPAEELTAAEKAERFQAEKQAAIDKLDEASRLEVVHQSIRTMMVDRVPGI